MRVDLLKVVVILLVAGSGDSRPQRDGTRPLAETEVASDHIGGWRSGRSADNVRSDSRYTASPENSRKSYISYYRDAISSAGDRSAKVSSGSRVFDTGSSVSAHSMGRYDQRTVRVSELTRKTIPIVYRADDLGRDAGKTKGSESKAISRVTLTHGDDEESTRLGGNGRSSIVRSGSDLGIKQGARSKLKSMVAEGGYGTEGGGRNDRVRIPSIFETSSGYGSSSGLQASKVWAKEKSGDLGYVGQASGRSLMQISSASYRQSAGAAVRDSLVENSNAKVNNVQRHVQIGTPLSSQKIIPLTFTHEDAYTSKDDKFHSTASRISSIKEPFSIRGPTADSEIITHHEFPNKVTQVKVTHTYSPNSENRPVYNHTPLPSKTIASRRLNKDFITSTYSTLANPVYKQNTGSSSMTSKRLHNAEPTKIEKVFMNDTGSSGARTETPTALNQNERSATDSSRTHGRSVPSSVVDKNAIPFGGNSVKVKHDAPSDPANRLAQREYSRNVTSASKGQRDPTIKSSVAKETSREWNKIDDSTSLTIVKKDRVGDRSDSSHVGRTKTRGGLNNRKFTTLNVNRGSLRRNEARVGQRNSSMVLTSRLKIAPSTESQAAQRISSTDKVGQGHATLTASGAQNSVRNSFSDRLQSKHANRTKVHYLLGELVTQINGSDVGQRQDSMSAPNRKDGNVQATKVSLSDNNSYASYVYPSQSDKKDHSTHDSSHHAANTKVHDNPNHGNDTNVRNPNKDATGTNETVKLVSSTKTKINTNSSQAIFTRNVVGQINFYPNDSKPTKNSLIITKANINPNALKTSNMTMTRYDLNSRRPPPLYAGDIHRLKNVTLSQKNNVPVSTEFLKNWPNGDLHDSEDLYNYEKYVSYSDEVNEEKPSFGGSQETQTSFVKDDASEEDTYHGIHWLKIPAVIHQGNNEQISPESVTFEPIYENLEPNTPLRPADADSGYHSNLQGYVPGFASDSVSSEYHDASDEESESNWSPIPTSTILSKPYDVLTLKRPTYHPLTHVSQSTVVHILNNGLKGPNVTVTELKDSANSKPVSTSQIVSPDSASRPNVHIMFTSLKDNSTNSTRQEIPPLAFGENCPTITINSFTRVNNTLQSKEGCTDLNIVINSHVLSTNVFSPTNDLSDELLTGASSEIGGDTKDVVGPNENDKYAGDSAQAAHLVSNGNYVSPSSIYQATTGLSDASNSEYDSLADVAGTGSSGGLISEVFQGTQISITSSDVQGDESLNSDLPSVDEELLDAEEDVAEDVSGGSSVDGSALSDSSSGGSPGSGSSLGGSSGGSSLGSPGQALASPAFAQPGVVEGQSNGALAPGSLQLPNLPSFSPQSGGSSSLGSSQNGLGPVGGSSGHHEDDDDEEDDFDLSPSGAETNNTHRSLKDLQNIDLSLRTVATQLLNVTNPDDAPTRIADTTILTASGSGNNGVITKQKTEQKNEALLLKEVNSAISNLESMGVSFGRPINSKFGYFESSHPGQAMAMTEEELERELSSTRLMTVHKNQQTTTGGISTWILLNPPSTTIKSVKDEDRTMRPIETEVKISVRPSSGVKTEGTSQKTTEKTQLPTTVMQKISSSTKKPISTTRKTTTTTQRPERTTTPKAERTTTQKVERTTTPKPERTTQKMERIETLQTTKKQRTTTPSSVEIKQSTQDNQQLIYSSATTKKAQVVRTTVKPKTTTIRTTSPSKVTASPMSTTKRPGQQNKKTAGTRRTTVKPDVNKHENSSTAKIEKVTFKPVQMISTTKGKPEVTERPMFITKIKASVLMDSQKSTAVPISTSTPLSVNTKSPPKNSSIDLFEVPVRSRPIGTKINNILKVQLKKPVEDSTTIEVEPIKVNAPILTIEKIDKQSNYDNAEDGVDKLTDDFSDSKIDSMKFDFSPELTVLNVDSSTEKPTTTTTASTTTRRRSHNKRKKNKLRRRRPASSTTSTTVMTTAATPEVELLPTEPTVLDNAIQESKIEPESKIVANATKMKKKPTAVAKPISTQIYNFLSREVMPSFGVMSLVGLGLGLASYFLYPFSGAITRRNYEVEPNYTYNLDEYGGNYGQREEDVMIKVLQGMTNHENKVFDKYHYQMPDQKYPGASSLPYKPGENKGSSLKYRNTDYRYSEPQTTPHYYDRSKRPEFVVGQEVVPSTGNRQFVVGNVPKEYPLYDDKMPTLATANKKVGYESTEGQGPQFHRDIGQNYNYASVSVGGSSYGRPEVPTQRPDDGYEEIEITPTAVAVEHGPRSLKVKRSFTDRVKDFSSVDESALFTDRERLSRSKRDSVIQIIPSRRELAEEEKEEDLSNEILNIIDSALPGGEKTKDREEENEVHSSHDQRKKHYGNSHTRVKDFSLRSTTANLEHSAHVNAETTSEDEKSNEITTTSNELFPDSTSEKDKDSFETSTREDMKDQEETTMMWPTDGSTTQKPGNPEENFSIFNFVKKVAEIKFRLGLTILKHASEGFARYLGHVQKRLNGEE